MDSIVKFINIIKISSCCSDLMVVNNEQPNIRYITYNTSVLSSSDLHMPMRLHMCEYIRLDGEGLAWLYWLAGIRVFHILAITCIYDILTVGLGVVVILCCLEQRKEVLWVQFTAERRFVQPKLIKRSREQKCHPFSIHFMAFLLIWPTPNNSFHKKIVRRL